MTVLLTTHYMDEADRLCDRLALMHHGRIRAEGSPAELKAALGEDATLEDVFRHFAGGNLDDANQGGDYREVRSARRTASRRA
jgi:ABC-2 type transport system ATP-binding protein